MAEIPRRLSLMFDHETAHIDGLCHGVSIVNPENNMPRKYLYTGEKYQIRYEIPIVDYECNRAIYEISGTLRVTHQYIPGETNHALRNHYSCVLENAIVQAKPITFTEGRPNAPEDGAESVETTEDLPLFVDTATKITHIPKPQD